MGLVRVEATTYSEALRDIRTRYGDAVRIVHTRVIRRKGMLGVLGATGVEVYVTGRSEYEEWRRRPPEEFAEGNASGPAQSPAPAPPPRRIEPSHWTSSTRQSPQAPGDFGRASDPPEVLAALERLSQRIGHVMAERAHRANSAIGAAPPKTPPSSVEASRARPATPAVIPTGPLAGMPTSAGAPHGNHPVVIAAKRLLEEGGFSPSISSELLSKLSRRQLPTLSGEVRECRELARLQLRELVRPKLPPARPIPRPSTSGRRRVVALVGPTGVGKTTTLAKLGALFRIREQARVAFITLDTYRIGAVDQLRRYADIIQVPLEVVSAGSGLPEALERVREADLVLVDTAGRSQKDADRIGELREMLGGVADLEVHLCLALSAAPEAIIAAAENFRSVGYSRILITKLDEAYRHGVLLDLFATAMTPISYVTCGQEVPDDIGPATPERLEDLLLGES